VAIWGNHSTTQYPDARNARIAQIPVFEVIDDHGWLKGKFIETVQKRGAEVIEKRGASSAASAANAVVDSVVSVRTPTPWGDWHSLAVVSHGEYGIPEGLQFGFPVRSDGERWEVVTDLEHDNDAKDRIWKTTQELMQERDMVKSLVPAQPAS
jgi:malate dehydrogenase